MPGGCHQVTLAARVLAALLAAAGLASAASAQAAACLDRETLTAARVHEFETLMMAVSLRCKAIGVNIAPSYEAMLDTHRAMFSAADRRVRSHFDAEPRAYERYATTLGNKYGGGATNPASCEMFGGVAAELARTGSGPASLGKVVFSMIRQPHLDGAICPVKP